MQLEKYDYGLGECFKDGFLFSYDLWAMHSIVNLFLGIWISDFKLNAGRMEF